MTTSVIDVPFPPGYGTNVDVRQPVDAKKSVRIGTTGDPWIATSGGNYYYDFAHGLESQDTLHEAYKISGLASCYPKVKRISNNVVRVFWNTNEPIQFILLRLAQGY